MKTPYKAIVYGKSDIGLLRWNYLASRNDEAIRSYLIRTVIMRYLHNESPIIIGKICILPEIAEDMKKLAPVKFNLVKSDDPEINAWFEQMSEQNIKVAKVIKELMKRSLEIVASPAEEWVPSYFEIDLFLNKYRRGVTSDMTAVSTPTSQPVYVSYKPAAKITDTTSSEEDKPIGKSEKAQTGRHKPKKGPNGVAPMTF